MTTLRRVHDAHGQFKDIQGRVEILLRARAINFRDPDDWDVFGLRDPQLSRIADRLNRMKSMTRGLGRAEGNVVNHSSDLSRMFLAWSRLHVEQGEAARPTRNAKAEFLVTLINWQGEITGARREIATSRREIRRQRGYYQRIETAFRELASIATRAISIGLSSAHQAQAYAFLVQFTNIHRRARDVAGNYDRGLAAISTWQQSVTFADRDLQVWNNWMRNSRAMNRSLTEQRAPN
ncbi:MAG: hypothetical protein GQ535_11595 [Rhodobacteraceae bacterium]|nr:hypothetical protein [Paracoccaceae bacterium]